MRTLLFIVTLLAFSIRPTAADEVPFNRDWPFSEERARKLQEETATVLNVPVEYRLTLSKDVEMVFVLIPAGEFEMGTHRQGTKELMARVEDYELRQRISDEAGPRRVRITRPFYMGKYEITYAQWSIIMVKESEEPEYKPEHMLIPVDTSWLDICSSGWFLERINDTSLTLPFKHAAFRLPTEAEWEYACRAGSLGDYAGSGVAEEMGWFDKNSDNKPSPIGLKEPNAWGLHDMHGNVAEWCADQGIIPYHSHLQGSWIDPAGPLKKNHRHIVRGGSWKRGAIECRSASRDMDVGHRGDIGFRLVLAIFPSEVFNPVYRPSPGIDPESLDTVEYVLDEVKYIGTPILIDRFKHANRLYRERSRIEYRALWTDVISELKVVPLGAPNLDKESGEQIADGPLPGDDAVYVLSLQLEAKFKDAANCRDEFILYLKDILPCWKDHRGEATVLMALAKLHYEDPEQRLKYYKMVTKSRAKANIWEFQKQQAWQEIARYYEAREEYDKAIDALNNWVIREPCGTGAAHSRLRRRQWLIRLRVKNGEEITAFKKEVWQ